MNGGRPSKLTKARKEKFLGLVRKAVHREQAARAAGWSAATFYRYVARGMRESSGLYHDFVEELLEAEALAEADAVEVLHRGMAYDNWRAALALLERRFPERWGRRQTTEVVGAGGGPIQTQQLETSQLSDEDLRRLQEIYARARRPE